MTSKNSKIFLAGHNGLVGSAILKQLISRGYKNIITVSKKKLDLRNQKKVFNFKFKLLLSKSSKVLYTSGNTSLLVI